MQQQIATFLFHHNKLPLPGIGTLTMHHKGATGDFTSKSIAAPVASIGFEKTESDTSALLDYLSGNNSSERDSARRSLEDLCTKLKLDLAAQKQYEMPGIGILYADSNGDIHFTEQALPVSFLQPVYAERVIHPNDEHQILVGDKEKTNTQMTEMLAPKEEKRENWWIWAIVLSLIAITAIMLYFGMSGNNASLGNSIKI